MNPATKLPVHGVFSASATPVLADGTPDHATFAIHAKALLQEGCDGIALLGTTGEANSFSLAQRMALVEKVIDAGVDAKRLLPGTSQTNVADTITLTKHAIDAGVQASVVLPPFYYKGVSDEGLFRFYAEVIEGVGSNALRIVLYHIPPIAQVGISLELTGRLLEAFPGIVVGVKDSSGKIESVHAAVAQVGRGRVHHLELQPHREAPARRVRQLVRAGQDGRSRRRTGPHQRVA
jgi:4-hydroxy-tetrahydrodipicolinate synthase